MILDVGNKILSRNNGKKNCLQVVGIKDSGKSSLVDRLLLQTRGGRRNHDAKNLRVNQQDG